MTPLFKISIGRRNAPRLSFEASADDAARAFEQHVDLAQEGEAVRITALHLAATPAWPLTPCQDMGAPITRTAPPADTWDARAVELLRRKQADANAERSAGAGHADGTGAQP